MTNPISSFDPNAIALLTEKLEKLQKLQELMKAANKIIRKKNYTDERKVMELQEQLGFTQEKAQSLLKPDFAQRIGYPDYAITNNGATIKNIKARIEELSAIAAKADEPVEDEGYPALGLTVVRNQDANRLQLVFDKKPNEEVRSLLRSRGFKWSPTNEAWQRFLNNNGEYAAKCVIEELQKAQCV